MKAAILSDIHANLEALNAVLQDCEREGVDRFWLLGDYVDYGANPIEVVSRLAGLNAEYIVAGNHDACLYNSSVRHSVTPHGAQAFAYTKRIIGKNRGEFAFLQTIINKPTVYLAKQKLLLAHGTPNDPYWGKFLPGAENDRMFADMERLDVRTLIIGHSHVGFLLQKGGRVIINPGSVGQPRDGCPLAAYAILDQDSIVFRRVPYDIDGASAAIKSAGLPEYLWQRLYYGM